MKGDPTPVCHDCNNYLTNLIGGIQLYDGRVLCIPCLAVRRRVGDAPPSEREVARALASIKEAGHG